MANINANLNADSKDFVRGVENAEDALETLIDSMDDAEKESVRSANKIEKSLKDVTEAAKDTSKASRPIGKGFKDAASDASEGLQEIKDESKSTAKEAAASFDGSAESIVDAFQEVAANAFAGFGAAGLVAGAAVAAGIGIATAEFQRTQEAVEAAKERIREFGITAIESGLAVAELEKFDDALKSIVTNSDDAAVKLDDLESFTKKYGDRVPAVEDMAMAYAGNAEAIDSVVKSLEDAIEAEKEHNDTTGVGVEESDKRILAYEKQIDAIKKVGKETEAMQAIEEAYAASSGNVAATQLATLQTINSAYDEVVTGVDAFYNAETKAFDVTAYAASIEERSKLLQDYQNNLASSGLTPEQISALNEMGVEQANALLNGLKDPGVAQETKDTITKGLSDSAGEASGVAQGKMKETFGKEPIKPKIEPYLDDKGVKSQIEQLVKAKTLDVTVRVKDSRGVYYP